MYITGRWEPTRRKGGSMGSPMQGVPTKGETFEMTWPRCSIFINLEKLPPDWTVQILSNNLSHLLNLHDSQINSWTNTVDYVIYSETNITHHLTEAFKPNKTCTSIPTYLSETERNENSNTHRTSHRTSKKARTMRKNPTHALGGNFPIRSFSSPISVRHVRLVPNCDADVLGKGTTTMMMMMGMPEEGDDWRWLESRNCK